MSSYLATRFHDQLSQPAPRPSATTVASDPQDGFRASTPLPSPTVSAPPAAPAAATQVAPRVSATAPKPSAPTAQPLDFAAGGLFSATQSADGLFSATQAAGGSFGAEPAWSAPAAPPVTHYQSPVSLYIPMSSFHQDHATPAPAASSTKLTPLQQMGYYSGKDIQHSGAMAAMGYGSPTPQAKPTGIAALGYNLAK